MTIESYSKPLPRIDELTQPFWDAAREGRLAIQRCHACGYYNHPPKPLCDACSSEDLAFETVSGRGRVYSYTIMHQRNVAGFEGDVPYVNLIVELDEQPLLFLISDLPGSAADRVAIGRPVEVAFEPAAEGIVLPRFRLVE